MDYTWSRRWDRSTCIRYLLCPKEKEIGRASTVMMNYLKNTKTDIIKSKKCKVFQLLT